MEKADVNATVSFFIFFLSFSHFSLHLAGGCETKKRNITTINIKYMHFQGGFLVKLSPFNVLLYDRVLSDTTICQERRKFAEHSQRDEK